MWIPHNSFGEPEPKCLPEVQDVAFPASNNGLIQNQDDGRKLGVVKFPAMPFHFWPSGREDLQFEVQELARRDVCPAGLCSCYHENQLENAR